nr:SDR family oxidoreductase [Pleurocapsa sp. CCALA 161]
MAYTKKKSMYFAGQHAIITGGSSGIGKAVAKLLAKEGMHISIIARSKTKLEAATNEIKKVRVKTTQQVLALSVDVAEGIQVKQAINTFIDQIGSVDLLITSAGIAHPGYFQDLEFEIFERTMAVNYFGTLYAIKAVLGFMEQKRQGHIVLISSAAGLTGIYGYTPYCPSKFALRGLAESLRGELKLFGIDLSIVYPPDTDTPQLEQENKTKPLETKAITGSAGIWSAHDVAYEIVKGIKKKSFAITPGWEITLLSYFHSVLFSCLGWYADRLVAKVRKENEEKVESNDQSY